MDRCPVCNSEVEVIGEEHKTLVCKECDWFQHVIDKEDSFWRRHPHK